MNMIGFLFEALKKMPAYQNYTFSEWSVYSPAENLIHALEEAGVEQEA